MSWLTAWIRNSVLGKRPLKEPEVPAPAPESPPLITSSAPEGDGFQPFLAIKDVEDEDPEEKELRIFDCIASGHCPECRAKDSMLKGPSGGMAMNIKCAGCGSVYWITPIRGFGAKLLRQDPVG